MKILKKIKGQEKERIIRDMNTKERIFWIATIAIMLLILNKS